MKKLPAEARARLPAPIDNQGGIVGARNPESLLYKGLRTQPTPLFSCYMVGKGK
jgi:hypothetical protein